MKEKFLDQDLSEGRLKQIQTVNEILEEYAAQDFTLTLRQLYYQLVTREIIPNLKTEYRRLMMTVKAGRLNGLIDWNMIEDRTRIPYLEYAVDSIDQALEDTVDQYKLQRQSGQRFHMELWTEKDAVSKILKQSSRHFHIRLIVNRGFSSWSAFYQASIRFLNHHSLILYVGDHDPSGLDMMRSIEENLKILKVENFEIVNVALRKDQISRFKLPSNPTKSADPRAQSYVKSHGEKCWELDALNPGLLDSIITQAIKKYLDVEQFEKMMRKEKRDRRKLSKLLSKET